MAIPVFTKYPNSLTSPSTFASDMDIMISEYPAFISGANAQAAAIDAIAAGTAVGIPYTFSTTTTDADPGAGYLRLDNATQNTATTIRADLVGADGTTWTDVLATFDDSDSTIKGYIMLQKLSDATKWILFSVSSMATPTGYCNITVAVVGSSAASPFANNDSIVLKFTRTGDRGAAGGNIANIVEATTATTLTSTKTLLSITPASYGVAVTLPDATTCTEDALIHVIYNKGVYPIKVLNTSGTLLGFVFAGYVTNVSLVDNATAAGVWGLSNSQTVGCSASLETVYFNSIQAVIDLGSGREIIIGRKDSTGYIHAVVYNATTNAFGSVVTVRAAAIAADARAACLVATDKVMVVSCNATTGFEAVILSVSDTAITVNTPATATLSANISSFADSGANGLIAVGSSFVTSYAVATPACQIRALTVSGTTVTIGNATVLSGTAGGIQHSSGDVLVIGSNTSTDGYISPYTISGTTITIGTQAVIAEGGYYLPMFFAPTGESNRWFFVFRNDANGYPWGGIAKLATTTITVSIVELAAANQTPIDAIIVTSRKLLVLTNGAANNCNILHSDAGGVASAGTPITISGGTGRSCIYVSGTDAIICDSDGTYYRYYEVDCSGTSPVLGKNISGLLPISGGIIALITDNPNKTLNRGPNAVYTTNFAQHSSGGTAFVSRIHNKDFQAISINRYVYNAPNVFRGKLGSEVWAYSSQKIAKTECVVL